MNKRIALWMTVLVCLAATSVFAAESAQGSLNVLRDLSSKVQGGAVVVDVTGTYPILDYTYYDYDPETFVVDMADVDVTQLPKTLNVNTGGVGLVKVEAISQAKGRSLAKIEIHKAYLAKCLVTAEGAQLHIRIVASGDGPALPVPAAPPAVTPPAAAPPSAAPRAATPPPVAQQLAPVPASPDAPAAQKLNGVAVAEDGSAVNLRLDGAARYKFFSMKDPNRIVIDLMGAAKGSVPNEVAGAGDISRVRVSLFKADPLVTRVVLDLKGEIPQYQVAMEGNSLTVRLGVESQQVASKTEQKPAAPAAPPSPAPPSETPSPAPAQPVVAAPVAASTPAPVPETPAVQAPSEAPANTPPAPSEPAAQAPAQPQAAPAPVEAPKQEAQAAPAKGSAKPAQEPLDKIKVNLAPASPSASREFKGYEDLFVAQDTAPQAAEGKTIMAGGVPLSFKERTISGGGVKYSGEPISLSLKDADIRDVLRVFHDISKMNIVVNPAVSGKVTVDLENVPWDQAMDIVLKNDNLDYIYENNVIWVAPASEIARRFSDQQRLQKEKLLAEEPVTFSKRLSYAKAGKMESIASKFLSDRGTIIVDERTNTLIIQEVPSKKDSLVKLIDSLDTATPQVLIEARIVETSITWDQSFGIVWSGNWYTHPPVGNTPIPTTNGGATPSGSNGATPVTFGNTTGWPNLGTGDFAVTLPPSASNGFLDLVLGNTSGSFFLDVRLAAMENSGRGRILSAPRVVTQDNEAASIEQGTQIPIRIATTDKISVVFVNATLKLLVTPQISADGNVNMVVDVQNDSVDYAHQDPGQPPPINKKEAKTTLKVRDGATAVIGGIFVTNEGISQSGLPFLSRIPVLGWLFKNRTKNRSNNELLIFLTPKIVR